MPTSAGELLTIRKLRPGEKRRTCEVQPHSECPDGCHKRAAYEVRFLDAVSWLCAEHFVTVKAELDGGAPITIKPDGPGAN